MYVNKWEKQQNFFGVMGPNLLQFAICYQQSDIRSIWRDDNFKQSWIPKQPLLQCQEIADCRCWGPVPLQPAVCNQQSAIRQNCLDE